MNGIEKIKQLNEYAATFQQIAKDQRINASSEHPAPIACSPQVELDLTILESRN